MLQSGANIVSFTCAFHYSLVPFDEVIRSSGSTEFPFENYGSVFLKLLPFLG